VLLLDKARGRLRVTRAITGRGQAGSTSAIGLGSMSRATFLKRSRISDKDLHAMRETGSSL